MHVLWRELHLYRDVYLMLNNAVSSKTKKLVDGRATLPKKITEIEIVCRVSHEPQ